MGRRLANRLIVAAGSVLHRLCRVDAGRVASRVGRRTIAVMRFKLTIEYAGTRYSGWQIQKNARTVQGEIDRAVRAATGRKDFELYGSGRPDAGVHAAAQVAHLDVATSLVANQLAGKINDLLPSDIHIRSAT